MKNDLNQGNACREEAFASAESRLFVAIVDGTG